MPPGKLEWRDLENCYPNKNSTSVVVNNTGYDTVRPNACSEMIRSYTRMEVRESQRRVEPDPPASGNGCHSIPEGGSILIECVDRFFTNPQQNYEVPLHLLQEWFSELATHRRLELARVFLAILQEQGVDMDKIFGAFLTNSPPPCKNNAYTNTETDPKEFIALARQPHHFIRNNNGQPVEMRDVSCGSEEPAFVHPMEWAGPNPCSVPDQLGLKSERNLPVDPKPERFHETVPKKPKLNKAEGRIILQSTRGMVAKEFENANVAYVEYPVVVKSKATRSVATSPFHESRLKTKCLSEPNLVSVVSQQTKCLRRSKSLPLLWRTSKENPFSSVHSKKCYASKQTTVTPVLRTHFSGELTKTVISGCDKSQPTFVEMSQAEFMKRQMMLNEKVEIRQGFRVGEQILFVPELGEKNAQPLMVHDLKRPREIKLAMMGNNEIIENVVVSQTSTSHTIHYTPSHSHIAIASSQNTNSQLINDKNSVVYLRENVAQQQPVLVTPPATTWQEEARKKPIIAYAKRKPSEPRDKPGVIFGDKLLQNGKISNAQESQQTKVISQTNAAETEPAISVVSSVGSAPSLPSMTTCSANSENYVKRAQEERRNPVLVAPSRSHSPKPTLPKFNQTFVQNYQLKPLRTPEPKPQQMEYLRSLPKKMSAPYSALSQSTQSGDSAPMSQDTSVITSVGEDVAPLTPINPISHTHIPPTTGVIHSALSVTSNSVPVVVQDRPVQVKTVSSAPAAQVGLLIYTQGPPEDVNQVQTLLLTTLPNGSAYCVRLPGHANLPNVAIPAISPHDASPRPLLVQAIPQGAPVALTPVIKKPDIPVTPPAESNKVALLKDLKEFENVFEETKLKFEKEKQLNVGEMGDVLPPVVNIDSPVQTATPPPPPPPPPPPAPQSTQTQTSVVTAVPKYDCDKVVVGVKRKAEEIPVVTRLYTAVKKPLIVVANYGATAPAQVQTRPAVTQVCNPSPPAAPLSSTKPSKAKSRSGKSYPNPSKSPPSSKPQQKPQEDEKTQQKIFAILEEYAVQKEHSPDTNNRPAPRRRSNPPSSSASKKKRPLLKCKDASGESEDGSFSEM